MDVAELYDAQAIERSGKAVQPNLSLRDLDPVTFNLARIEG
jgi:hypothetical protein